MLKFFKWTLAILVLLCVTLYFLYLRLGYLLDISEPPRKADILCVLAGDWSGNRVKKAYELFRQGYSASGKICVNDRSAIYLKQKDGTILRTDKAYLLAHGVAPDEIIELHRPGTTVEEVRAIKAMMLKHGFRSVLVVTDPPHTRRVRMLAESVADFDDAGLKLILVGSDAPWWHKARYYDNLTAKKYAFSEAAKIPLNYFAYAVLDRYHLLGVFRRCFNWLIHGLRDFFESFLRHLR